MEIRNADRYITFDGETLRLFDASFDFEQRGGSEKQVKPIKIIGVEAEEPKYFKFGYGFVMLVHSESKPLPTELSAKYEVGKKDHFAIELDKKQWAKSQELVEKIKSIIAANGSVNLLDLTEASFPAPKVKSTKVDAEWSSIRDQISEALRNTPVTGFFIFGVDDSEIYIQGGFNSPTCIYLEAAGGGGALGNDDRFKEAGWQSPNENSDFLNYWIEARWGEGEVNQVSNFIVNTLSWVYELDAASTELSISVQDND
jgi:hypothetical protein